MPVCFAVGLALGVEDRTHACILVYLADLGGEASGSQAHRLGRMRLAMSLSRQGAAMGRKSVAFVGSASCLGHARIDLRSGCKGWVGVCS